MTGLGICSIAAGESCARRRVDVQARLDGRIVVALAFVRLRSPDLVQRDRGRFTG